MRGRRTTIREITLLELSGPYPAHTTFRLCRITQPQHLESRRNDMTTHIPKSAGAIIPPAPPIERHQVVHIIAVRRRIQTQVPIHPRRYRCFLIRPRNPLWPYGPVGETNDLRHIPDHPGPIPVYQLPDPVAGSTLVAHLAHYLITGRCLCQHP